MIVAERREGSLREPVDTRAGYAPLWRHLDRKVPLAVKLAGPVLPVTLLAIVAGGLIVVQQIISATEAGYVTSANAIAHAAAMDFTSQEPQQQDISGQLHDLAAGQPLNLGIWVVDILEPGTPVVASSDSTDIGRTQILESNEIATARSGGHISSTESQKGMQVLETIQPIDGGRYAVVVLTSLQAEAAVVARTIAWVVGAGLVGAILDIAGLGLILEWGVVRRIRRIERAVASYGRKSERVRLSEGDEPPGADILFNLAREIDRKLGELNERERAGDVISDLGLASLQGAAPEELTAKALALVRRTANLDRCFLVDTSGAEVVVTSFDDAAGTTSDGVLPIWLGALVRASTRSRRPVLADRLGEDCRFWEAHTEIGQAAAVFVPLPGAPDPVGVMVGLARPGSHVNAAVVNFMEGVATTLGETLQRSAADKARQESQVKSRALSTVSHEMRNPLNAMLGFTSLLVSGAAGPLNEKQEQYVKRVDEASHHLLSLVNDYLDLARIMAGSMPVTIEAVPVEVEVKSVLELMRPTATEKHVSLHATLAPGLVAHVDKMRLRQVVLNLVSNAIKFTPAHGHVRVEAAGGSNGIRISVIDTGIGIPADRQHLIFTEFAQLHQGDAANGSGLGLVLTKRFVEAMGGFIRFTSSEGAGTIFDIWLPGENSPRVSELELVRAV